MSSETNDDFLHDPQMAALGHWSLRVGVPVGAAASALSVFHDRGVIFSIAAVALWVLFALCAFAAPAHNWQVCSHCDTPPRFLATPAARARLAHACHRRWPSALLFLAFTGVFFQAVLPKPYMVHWWAKLAAGVAYFVLAVLTGHDIRRAGMHRLYREECHLDWCRAGLHRPGETWLRRFRRWAAHYGIWILLVRAPVTCILGLYEMHHDSILLRLAYAAAVFTTGRSVINTLVVHTSVPCVRCARHLPDKPEEAAERRMPWLRRFHRARVTLLAGSLLAWTVSLMLAGTAAAKLLLFAMTVGVVCWMILERIHSPVKPWCPWCKDDGGEDAEAGVPDPTSNVPAPA